MSNQIWLNKENEHSCDISDADLYQKTTFKKNYPESVKGKSVSYKKLATDLHVVHLDGKYLSKELNKTLNREVIQLNKVCWLLLTGHFKIPINQMKSMLSLTDDDRVMIKAGFRMSKFEKNNSRGSFRGNPIIKLNVENKFKGEQPFDMHKTDPVFEDEEEFKFYAKSSEVEISMEDIIEIKKSGKKELDIRLAYDDTRDRNWKTGQRWLYAEIVITKIDPLEYFEKLPMEQLPKVLEKFAVENAAPINLKWNVEYSVTVEGKQFTATGSHENKKEAKKIAAKNLHAKLEEHEVKTKLVDFLANLKLFWGAEYVIKMNGEEIKETALHESKKVAKQMAAKNLLKALKSADQA
jgi:hypothetical protein